MARLERIDTSRMDWSGFQPIAVLALEPPELSARAGLTFQPGWDDLDSLQECAIRSGSGTILAFIRHVSSPKPGTELLVKASGPGDANDQLDEALRALDLTRSDVLWTAPLVERPARKPATRGRTAAKRVSTRVKARRTAKKSAKRKGAKSRRKSTSRRGK